MRQFDRRRFVLRRPITLLTHSGLWHCHARTILHQTSGGRGTPHSLQQTVGLGGCTYHQLLVLALLTNSSSRSLTHTLRQPATFRIRSGRPRLPVSVRPLAAAQICHHRSSHRTQPAARQAAFDGFSMFPILHDPSHGSHRRHIPILLYALPDGRDDKRDQAVPIR